MSVEVSVFIVTDIRLYRDGLAQSLGRRSEIRVLGTAVGTEGLAERMGELAPDVVLVDVVVPGSLEAIRAMRDASPSARIVALAVPEAEAEVLAYAEAGVAGFIPRDASLDELVACVRAACRDELLCSPRVAAILLRRVTSLARTQRSEAAPVALTSRQAEILDLIGQGLSNKEIARQLCIELSTVKNHVHQILDRLQVHRRAEAAALVRPLVATDLDHLTANKAEKPATNGHGI